MDRELERQAIHLRRPLRVRQPLDLHQRLHQYRGGHRETYAGVTINIDSSIVDAPVAGPGGIGPTTPPPSTPLPTPTPTPTPAPTPGAGTGSTPDGIATVDWPANAFSTAATVTLSSATLPKKTQGFAAGSYIAQLKAQSTTGTQIARFAAPTVLHFGPLAPGLVPAYSPDGTTWTPLPRSNSTSLPNGIDSRYTRAQDGSIKIATLVPGLFGLLLDTARPSRPTVTARLTRGALQLRWQPATDNSTTIAGYRVTFGGKPILTLAGTTTHATLTSFHSKTTSVFRVIAADSAANQSDASKAIVIAPKRRPQIPAKPIPKWAWQLAAWQATGKHGTRPTTPTPVPPWYWTWADWRQQPYRIQR